MVKDKTANKRNYLTPPSVVHICMGAHPLTKWNAFVRRSLINWPEYSGIFVCLFVVRRLCALFVNVVFSLPLLFVIVCFCDVFNGYTTGSNDNKEQNSGGGGNDYGARTTEPTNRLFWLFI